MTGRSAESNFTEAPSQTLGRVLTVLETIVALGPSATLADVAAQAGLPKPTVHRFLAGLSRRGYVRRDEHGTYSPGPRTFALANTAQSRCDYALVARPALANLRTHTVDTIHVALRDGDQAVYITKLEAQRRIQCASKVGAHLDLHSTAMGKAILAALAKTDREALLARLSLVAHTTHTLRTLPALRHDLDLVAAQGFAVDNEENEDSVRCIAAAFRDQSRSVVGAVSISGPTFFLTPKAAIALGPSVAEAAAAISEALGCPAASANAV